MQMKDKKENKDSILKIIGDSEMEVAPGLSWNRFVTYGFKMNEISFRMNCILRYTASLA